MENKNKKFTQQNKKFEPKEVKATCRICGKKFHSLTTNKGGSIICPDCDYDFDTYYTLELNTKK